jgi:hypothetical protein
MYVITWPALAFGSLQRPSVPMKRPGLAYSSLVLLQYMMKQYGDAFRQLTCLGSFWC